MSDINYSEPSNSRSKHLIKMVLASGNEGKLKEIQQRLNHLPYHLVTQKSLSVSSADETGLSFVENAILKARHAAKLSHLPAIADDSGLVVPQLKGEPGIYSARYSGNNATDEKNNSRLLERLQAYPSKSCHASFHCAIVYLRHWEDPAPVICEGIWHGLISKTPSGKNGFGYDPLFWLPELGCTSAELSSETKNQLSHRGQALNQLIQHFTHEHPTVIE